MLLLCFARSGLATTVLLLCVDQINVGPILPECKHSPDPKPFLPHLLSFDRGHSNNNTP